MPAASTTDMSALCGHATGPVVEAVALRLKLGTPPKESRVVSGIVVDEVATGGTLFANALAMAAGLPALLDVLTDEAFTHTASLGERMAASGSRARGWARPSRCPPL